MGKVVELFGEAPEGEFPSEFCFSSPMLYEDKGRITFEETLEFISTSKSIKVTYRFLVEGIIY